jgi:type II secretory pathway component PulF
MNTRDRAGTKPSRWLQCPWIRVSRKNKMIFYTCMAQLFDAGVPLFTMFDLLRKQQGSRVMRKVSQKIGEHVMDGESIASAMKRYPRLFSLFEIRMMEFAEASAQLPQTCNHLADTFCMRMNFWSQFWLRMIYPILLLVVFAFGVPLLQSFFLPEGDPQAVTLWISRTVGLLCAMILLAWALYKLVSQVDGFRYVFHTVFCLVPFFRGTVYRFARGRYASVLYSLYQAGAPVYESMMFAGDVCGNERIGRRIKKQVPLLKEGASIAGVLEASGVFTPISLGLMASGEISGSMDHMLKKLSEWELQEAQRAVEQMARAIPFVIYMLVMIFMAYMIITMYASNMAMLFHQIQ